MPSVCIFYILISKNVIIKVKYYFFFIYVNNACHFMSTKSLYEMACIVHINKKKHKVFRPDKILMYLSFFVISVVAAVDKRPYV